MNALALGLLAAFCWGIHDLSVRYISRSVSVVASLMTVLVVGACLQLGIIVVRGDVFLMPGRAAIFATVSGGFYLLAGLCMYEAFHRGPVRLVAPLVASYPVLSITVAIWRGSTVTAWQWLAVIAIGVGVSIAAAKSEAADTPYPAAGPTIVLSLLAAAGFAATFALGQYAKELSDEFNVTLLGRIAAIIGLVGFALVSRKSIWAGTKALPLLCLMGVLDAVAILCVISAGGFPDAQYASVAASVFGLLTVVLAWAVLKEHMAYSQWFGCIIAFAGIGYLAFAA